MTLKAAVDALCDVTVSGVTVFDLDTMPAAVIADLPALLPVLNYGSPGEMLYYTTAEDGRLVCQVEHWLLVSGVADGLPSSLVYSSLTHVDNYLAALAGDWTLNDTLIEPLAVVGLSFGPIDWFGALYFGVKFRLEWKVLI